MNTRIELCLRDVEFLFKPFRHRKLCLPTRLVLEAGNRGLCPGGLPSVELLRAYTRSMSAGIGLVMTEGLAVSPCATNDADAPEFYSGPSLRRWRRVVHAVHANGGRIAARLYHAGELRIGGSRRVVGKQPALSPSGIHPVTLQAVGEPMSRARMADIADAFALAAWRARALGFDAVAVNGPGGGLIDQFLHASTNRRSDEYGGSSVGRLRFVRELLAAVRRAVGARTPVILRLPQRLANQELRPASTPGELADIVQPLAEAGVDIFECASDSVTQPAFAGSGRSFAGWVRYLTDRPVIAAGAAVCSQAVSEQARERDIRAQLRMLLLMMQAGEFDLLAIRSASRADRAWAAQLRCGERCGD